MFHRFLFLIFFLAEVNSFQKIHVLSQIELLQDSNPNPLFKNIKRLFGSIYGLSNFHEVYEKIQYHICVYYDSNNYFQRYSRNGSFSGLNYSTYLFEKHHPNVSEFRNPFHRQFLQEFTELGIHFLYIPYDELTTYPERYLIGKNRIDFLNLFCAMHLGKYLLTNPAYEQYASFPVDNSAQKKRSKPSQSDQKDTFSTYQASPKKPSQDHDYIVFINSKYLVTNNHLIRYLTANPIISKQYDFHCLQANPRLPDSATLLSGLNSSISSSLFFSAIDDYQRIYNLNLFYLKVQLSIPLYLYFQSVLLSNSQSISTILQNGINSLTSKAAIHLIQPDQHKIRIVYSKMIYVTPKPFLPKSKEEALSIALIEFDDDNHRFIVQNCTIQLHVEWLQYNTLSIVQNVLNYRIAENLIKWNQLMFCAEVCFNEKCTREREETNKSNQLRNKASIKNPYFYYNELLYFNQHYQFKDLQLKPQYPATPSSSSTSASSPLPRKPRLFDCILFFNELSLLRLRLSLLSPLVSKHLILESYYTFTGKRKEPILTNHLSHFEEYREKMDVIVLDHLPFPEPKTIGEVWQNEYYSRNYFLTILQERYQIQRNDVLIIADTDEIIDPEIILQLSYMFYSQATFSGSMNAPSENDDTMDFPIKLPNIYKLPLNEYFYDFSCYIPSLKNYFPSNSPAAMIVSYGAAIDYVTQMNSPMDTLFYFLRMYRQHETVLSYQYLASDYVWHLSFFQLTMNEMKAKLEGYSHQNFASRFFDVEEERVKEYEQKTFYNQDLLPTGNISLKKLQAKIQKKQIVNGKEFRNKHFPNPLVHFLEKRLFHPLLKQDEEEEQEASSECHIREFTMKSELIEQMWLEIHLKKEREAMAAS